MQPFTDDLINILKQFMPKFDVEKEKFKFFHTVLLFRLVKLSIKIMVIRPAKIPISAKSVN